MKVGRWLLVVVGLVACGAELPPLPGRGGPSWLELESEHFTLWTDASTERADELMREMEQRYQVITLAMRGVPARTTSLVIALRDVREVLAYLPLPFIAMARNAANPAALPTVLLNANGNDRDH